MTPLISSSPISCVELWKDRAQEPGQKIRGLFYGHSADRWLLDFQREEKREPRTPLPTWLLMTLRPTPQEPAPA